MIVNIGCETFIAEFHIIKFMNNKTFEIGKTKTIARLICVFSHIVFFLFTSVFSIDEQGVWAENCVHERIHSSTKIQAKQTQRKSFSFINKLGYSLYVLKRRHELWISLWFSEKRWKCAVIYGVSTAMTIQNHTHCTLNKCNMCYYKV